METKNNNISDNFSRNRLEMDRRYQYIRPEPQHIDAIANLFTQAFCTSEPMTSYLAMDPNTYKNFATEVVEFAVQDGLSIIALDKKKVIACALVEDFAAMHETNIHFDPKFKYILALLEKLGADFFKNKQFNKNYIAHLFITAVDQQYRRQGLSTQINFRAMDLMARAGFEFVYCELTNIYNELGVLHHLSNHHRLIGNSIYKEFEFENIKPFSRLPGFAHSYLWEIHEGSRLTYQIDGIVHSEKF